MRSPTDEKALATELRHIEGSIAALEARHEARKANRKASAERPSVARRPTRAERPRCLARCKTREGAPCRAPCVVDRDASGGVRVRARCRLHGGLSSGPKTQEGLERVRDLAIARKRDAKGRWLPQSATEEGST